ncbi:MAG: DUF4402 domain-containing protein [Williamsia sp.]|nr:DUF4402 domain-containing protein [Williamsia sp.]
MRSILKRKNIRWLLAFLFSWGSYAAFAQMPTDSLPRDPARISVYVVQNLQFGSISAGDGGGTVTVSPTGLRSVTGTVIALSRGGAVLPALFEVEAPAGVIVTLQNGADAPLTGSNGGNMTLRLGASNPVSPFTSSVAPPGRTQVSVGGTLTVGNSTVSRPGTYSGTFSILFFQQ